MSKTTTVDQASSVALPPEALDALGVTAGAELDVEIVGRALVFRSGGSSGLRDEALFESALGAAENRHSMKLQTL